ncbi:hypothetical protein [Streptomyces viridosporus]|uniref:hypothetical protein n=1 Tax=Streptomyces viridosporus TaxID=67581 RepID=UPI0033309A78
MADAVGEGAAGRSTRALRAQDALKTIAADGRLRPAVASPRTPVEPAGLGREATGGRGVPLVEALSAAWGTLPVSGGKQVGAEFVLRW